MGCGAGSESDVSWVAWDKLTCNPITGRTSWAIRYERTGPKGKTYDWAAVVIRNHWFSKEAIVSVVMGMNIRKRRQLRVRWGVNGRRHFD